jgi:hypothetical protein
MIERLAAVIGLVLTLVSCSAPPTPPVSPTAAPLPVCDNVPHTTCVEALQVALDAVAASGRTPTRVWINRGTFCPMEQYMFAPNPPNCPAPNPPNDGTWVASVEIAFEGTDEHAGLNIAVVGNKFVAVLIGYAVP